MTYDQGKVSTLSNALLQPSHRFSLIASLTCLTNHFFEHFSADTTPRHRLHILPSWLARPEWRGECKQSPQQQSSYCDDDESRQLGRARQEKRWWRAALLAQAPPSSSLSSTKAKVEVVVPGRALLSGSQQTTEHTQTLLVQPHMFKQRFICQLRSHLRAHSQTRCSWSTESCLWDWARTRPIAANCQTDPLYCGRRQ